MTALRGGPSRDRDHLMALVGPEGHLRDLSAAVDRVRLTARAVQWVPGALWVLVAQWADPSAPLTVPVRHSVTASAEAAAEGAGGEADLETDQVRLCVFVSDKCHLYLLNCVQRC